MSVEAPGFPQRGDVRRRRTDRLVALGFVLVSAGTLVLTTWIGFRGWDALLAAVRHPFVLQQTQALYAGLLSSNLMVLQVVLLARLPWLERAWGRPVLMRRHRLLAHWSFWLMLVHVLLFVAQRSLRDGPGLGERLARLFVTGAWMLPATIGTGLLVLVVATSIARARRRLRYETWHLAHLWSYAGMGLALPHQLVSADFRAGWVEAYWWALYLGGLATVLVFRVGVPLWRSLRHDLRIEEVRRETPDAVSVLVGGRRLERLGALPGQFFVWRFLGGRGWTRGHPYSVSGSMSGSVSGSPGPGRLRVTIAASGDGGARAAALTPGSRVLVEGPYGAFGAGGRRHPHLVMLAAGVGITPFRALLEALPLVPGEATLVHRVRDEEHVLFRDELAGLAAARGIALVVLAGPRRAPYSWLPVGVEPGETATLRQLIPHLLDSDVLVCGPAGWAAAVRRAARRAGVAGRDVHSEEFSW